jgi:hypothetical protein
MNISHGTTGIKSPNRPEYQKALCTGTSSVKCCMGKVFDVILSPDDNDERSQVMRQGGVCDWQRSGFMPHISNSLSNPKAPETLSYATHLQLAIAYHSLALRRDDGCDSYSESYKSCEAWTVEIMQLVAYAIPWADWDSRSWDFPKMGRGVNFTPYVKNSTVCL